MELVEADDALRAKIDDQFVKQAMGAAVLPVVCNKIVVLPSARGDSVLVFGGVFAAKSSAKEEDVIQTAILAAISIDKGFASDLIGSLKKHFQIADEPSTEAARAGGETGETRGA